MAAYSKREAVARRTDPIACVTGLKSVAPLRSRHLGFDWDEALRPMRFPAAAPDILPLRSHIFFKRCWSHLSRHGCASEEAPSKFTALTGNAGKSGRVHVFAIESIDEYDLTKGGPIWEVPSMWTNDAKYNRGF